MIYQLCGEYFNKLKFSNLICPVAKLLIVWQVIKKQAFEGRTNKFIIVILSSDPLLTLIKLNELVDLVCVLFTPVQFPHPGLNTGGE